MRARGLPAVKVWEFLVAYALLVVVLAAISVSLLACLGAL